MKKILLVCLPFVSLICTTSGQVNPHAIGLRLPANNLTVRSPSLSYQLGIGPANRLDFGLGLSGGFSPEGDVNFITNFTLYYQHVWNINGGLNWFLGGGFNTQVGITSLPSEQVQFKSYLGVGPQIGLEYDFNIHGTPLLLGIDYRPTLGVHPNFSGNSLLTNNIGLSLRYTLKGRK